MNPDDNVNFGLISFDHLISCLDSEIIFPVFEKMLETALSNSDWRYKNAGLLSIGQIGEYLEDLEKIRGLIPILISSLTNPHPKCRFAALSSIGLLSDDLQPEFQNEFYKVLVSPMIAATDDPVPRVQSHACAALSNFLEHTSKSVAVEVIPVLLPKLIKLIQNGISVIKENAMTCISSLAESAAEDFSPYYKELVPYLFEIIKKATQKEYHLFRGQAIECITIISAAIGYDNFKEYSTSLIELFISIQDGELNKGDPQRFYLLGAWQRICLLMQKEFVPYLPKIIPNLLKIVSTVPGMSLSKSGLASGSLESIIREVCGEKSNQLELSTSETEEIEMGLQMLQVFATELREHFAPYVEETSKIVEPMLTFMSNPDLRKQSAKLLAPLLKSLSTAGCPRDSVVNIGSKFMDRVDIYYILNCF